MSDERIIVGMETAREKVCEACGATFGCRAGGCWCDEVKLDDATRAGLRERCADCLCPTCLKVAADGGLRRKANSEQSNAEFAPEQSGPARTRLSSPR